MILTTTINEDYAVELTLLHHYRDFSDGLSVVEFDCNFDWYDGDHCPKFDLSLRLFNWTIFEFNIYNRHHFVDINMSDIQKQCWSYTADWVEEDFEASDKAFIELVKNSGIVANKGSKPLSTTN
jgi:hypothetical protein